MEGNGQYWCLTSFCYLPNFMFRKLSFQGNNKHVKLVVSFISFSAKLSNLIMSMASKHFRFL